jgi:hypothetical protein
MAQRNHGDAVIELATRLGDDEILFSGEVSDADAEIVLEVLDEVEAEEKAANIVTTLRQQGHAL